MTDQIKNRVVGTIVLFTLAIIFLPDIFDGKKNELQQEIAVIPTKPSIIADTAADQSSEASSDHAVIKMPIATDDKPVATGDKPVATDDKSIAANDKPSEISEQPSAQQPQKLATVVKSAPLVKPTTFKRAGWVIQMGIFKQTASVKPYLKKLRAKGFTAFSVPNMPQEGESTTVYVGPELDRAKLAKLQPKLKAAFNEAGYLKKFNPTPNK